MAGVLTAAIAAAFSGSAVTTDPYYEYTTLLLPGNGTNGAQNNTFLDGSTNNFTITRNGNTTQGTFSPFSQTGWGNYFNGSNAYLSLTATSAVQLTNSTAFAIEFWVYPASIPSTGGSTFVLRAYNISSPYQGYGIAFGGNGLNTNLQIWNGTVWADIGAVSANTWTHIAVTYEGSGSTLRYFINGQQQGSATTVPSNINYTGTPFIIGARNSDFYLNGYISNLRIVKGSAVYTSNFTPSTTPLTAITNTSLLTCQSNRFLDNSGSPYTITPNGSPTVVAFSPFNPTASWSAATYGGSGYFDGSGDYLSVAGNAAFAIATSTTPFTIEGWIYPTAAGGVLFAEQFTGAGNSIAIAITMSDGIDIFTTTGRTIAFGYYNGSNWTIAAMANTTVPLNAYSHVACVFTGSTTKIYINGSDVTKTSSPTPATTWGVTGVNGDGWFVGKRWDSTATECFTGYIGGFRFVNGTAVYTGAFTPPTAPLTAITNTSLLLNFTNAGIYDATSKNDLETVGNAQISTAISAKWGTGSIKLTSASSDYLKSPGSNLYVLGTGDWTIECWVYLPSVATQQIIFDTRATGTDSGYAFYVTGVGKLALFTNNTSVLVTSSSVPSNSWAYLAMTRTGATVRAYINGTLDATTGTYSGSMNCPGTALVGAGAGGTDLVNGYIQDLRITKGYARTITASPTASFPTL